MKKEIYDAYMLNALPVGLDENFIGKESHIFTPDTRTLYNKTFVALTLPIG